MKVNYHTHTEKCLHAQGSEEDYVISAIKSNLDVLGFSDHAPFPDQDFGYRMPYYQLREYIDAIEELTEKYAADIILKKGLEIEYLPEYHKYYDELLGKMGFEYLILGEHFFHSPSGFYNITSVSSTERYIDYANAVDSAMQTGLFNMVAHPDIFMMNPYGWDYNCEKACDIIIQGAINTKTILEFNANGYRRGKKEFPDGVRYQYPHDKFWEKVSETNISVIIGSDCHNPVQVWDDIVEKAYAKIATFGIIPATTL